MLWALLGLMSLLAVAFVVWPLVRDDRNRSLLTGGAVVLVVATSIGLYALIGSPDLPSSEDRVPDVTAMVASLAERLEREPDDLNGWKMLGRSYMTLGNYGEAVKVFERVLELETPESAQSLVALGEALLASSGDSMTTRTVSLFENALALDPNNPSALFWGGIAAFNRGDAEMAASRWEMLLGTNPPPEVRHILEQRIAEWRGRPLDEIQPRPLEQPGAVVSASIGLSEAATAALPDDALVFVIARDPTEPTPPIAVTRRRLAELPAVIELGDGDSMIPGRSLSGFPEFELIARVSLSGQPAAQTGDWFGSTIVKPAEDRSISLSIDSRVP